MVEIQKSVYRMVYYFSAKFLTKRYLFAGSVDILMVFGIAYTTVNALVRSLVKFFHSF